MPELPEVETIRSGLEPVLVGKTIERIDVYRSNLRWPVHVDELERWIASQRVTQVDRRAKYLIWTVDNDASVILHLGMSGRLSWVGQDHPEESHTHVVFGLSDGTQVRYRDPRRFGLVECVPPAGLAAYPRFHHLGPEPLSSFFSSSWLFDRLRASRRPVKTLLMDATVVVGIGNIYANEICYYARIHPLRFANTLSREESKVLSNAVKTILRQALERGGTTLNDFADVGGEPGFFQLELSVYGKADTSCPRCGSRVEKRVLGGRSTFFCSQCQK
jgi:formamidopyrimidine-DNA glycosylase